MIYQQCSSSLLDSQMVPQVISRLYSQTCNSLQSRCSQESFDARRSAEALFFVEKAVV